jgi:hypothetical protein
MPQDPGSVLHIDPDRAKLRAGDAALDETDAVDAHIDRRIAGCRLVDFLAFDLLPDRPGEIGIQIGISLVVSFGMASWCAGIGCRFTGQITTAAVL